MTVDERVHLGPQLNDDDELLNRFAEECGVPYTVPIVVQADDTGGTWELNLRAPFIRVGRATHCQLVLSDTAVSRRHAYLQVLEGRIHCFDLDSRKGLQWSTGRRSRGVIDNTGIRIDPFSLNSPHAEFSDEIQPEDLEGIHAAAEDYSLQFTNATGRDSGTSRRQTRSQITFLGSSKRCHVKLSHESVKKFHCSLVRTADSFWAVDLSGDAGIFVNGERVAFAQIGCDDELTIGRFRMRLCEAEQESHLVLAVPQTGRNRRHCKSASATQPQPPQIQQNGVSGEALLVLMDQFAQLQQNMLDQNYQQTLLLAEVLNAADTGPIAGQLQHLEQITSELKFLYARSNQQQRPRLESMPATLTLPETTELEAMESGQISPVLNAPASPASDPLPRQQELEEAGDGLKEDLVQSTADPHAEPTLDDEFSDQPRFRADSPEMEPDPHLWLTQRISELERERQSGWQRILGLLSPTATDAGRPSVMIEEE